MSLASMKRRITVGTQLKLVRHDWFAKGGLVVHGNAGTRIIKPRVEVGSIRPVASVTGKGIGLTTGDSVSYLDWPKATSYRDTEKGFEIDLNGDGSFREVMGYEVIEAA